MQGWYHGEAAPLGSNLASISLLKSASQQGDDFVPIIPTSLTTSSSSGGSQAGEGEVPAKADAAAGTPPVLSDADKEFLGKWLNKDYLQESALSQIRARFEAESSVQLQRFLSDEVAGKLVAMCGSADDEDELYGSGRPSYDAGTSRAGWDLLGPAHIQRYQRKSQAASKEEDPGSILGRIEHDLFKSREFAQLLLCLTTLEVDGVKAEARRFRAGPVNLKLRDLGRACALCFVWC